MSINLSLISKIIGGLLTASTASYGGWVAYDVNNPTFHRFITEQGWVRSPIDRDMKINESWGLDRKEASSKMGGDWRCTKQLFSNLNPPSTDTSSADKGNAKSDSSGYDTPSKTSIQSSEWSDDESVGCLVADLGYTPDGKRNGFIKWELALRSKNRGFIYVGYVSFGATKENENSLGSQISFSLAFEVAKKESSWKIGKGFSWSDMLINGIDSTNGASKITVLLPDGQKWETNSGMCGDSSCSSLESWTFYKWVGFWEYKNDGNKQPTDALDIQVGEKSTSKSNKHDVWQTPDFDFKASNQVITEGNKKNTAWSSSIGEWYDGDESKWKDAKTSTGDKGYLEEIYKPWAKKKGTWMEVEEVCHQSNSRTMKETDEEAKRLLNFCYQNN